MKVVGIIHRLDANARVRTEVLEADTDQPVLEVFRAVYGPAFTAVDVVEGNTIPDSADAGPPTQNRSSAPQRTVTWGQWQSLNPVTLVGARSLRREFGETLVEVLAGPDSGYTISIDPRAPLLSRVGRSDCVNIADPCLSREPAALDVNPSRQQPFTALGATIFTPISPKASCRGPIPPTVVSPRSIDAPRPARPPQWWAFLIPIAIGLVLALVTGMWWFLLFSVSAPLSGYLAHALEKRRFARDRGQYEKDLLTALDLADDELCSLVSTHRTHLRTVPGLLLGFGAMLSPISIAPELHTRTNHFDGRAIVDDVPVRIDPLTTRVEVSGAPDDLLHMAMSWLVQDHWEWRLSDGLRTRPEFLGTRFADQEFSAPSTSTERSRTNSAIRLSLTDRENVSILILEPPAGASVVTITVDGLAQARILSSTSDHGPVPGSDLIATLMPAGRFLSIEHCGPVRSRKERFPLHGLGDLYDDDPIAIRHRWSHASPGVLDIGRNRLGTVGVDLFADGPHALVAGTTGSGKSILLQTWLLALALSHSPDQLTFVLIDFKGGATFSALERLPHTDCVLDDFDSAAAFRALVSVRAEITRRERLLAESSCSDVLELENPPPRLVVVIDEFHALMATHPRAAELLEHLTALGRSLGVHLILATQRPLGVVTGQMKANINIRMCLRVRDAHDSLDVLGVPDAADLPAESPGSACVDMGSELTEFRVAIPFTDSSPAEVVPRPRVRPWHPSRAVHPSGPLRGVSIDNLLIAAHKDSPSPHCTDPPARSIAVHSTEAFTSRTRPIVAPPLPTADELADLVDDDPGLCGVLDFPSEQDQRLWSYRPDVDGSLAVIASEPGIVGPVLSRLATAASSTHRVVALGRISSNLDWAEIGCGMDADWRFRSILTHLHEPGPPTAVVCDNWSELIDSLDHHTATEVEHLLKHARQLGLTFILAGSRPFSNSAGAFSSQVIFPPNSSSDGMSVGLSRQRFVGSWPEFRAVLVGPSAKAAGGDGADVQLAPFSGEESGLGPVTSAAGGTRRRDSERNRPGLGSEFEPGWHGLDSPLDGTAHAKPLALRSGSTGIPMGLDPFGQLVIWDLTADGLVLNVRGSACSGKTRIVEWIRQVCARSSSLDMHVHDDAHLETDPASLDLLDGAAHVVTTPVRFTPGYGSPLAKAQGMGPLLVLGVRSRQDLNSLGLTRLPPLDGPPGSGWFITENRCLAVRLFTTSMTGGAESETACLQEDSVPGDEDSNPAGRDHRTRTVNASDHRGADLGVSTICTRTFSTSPQEAP